MKKSFKAILSCVLGAMILGGCSSTGDLSGTIGEKEETPEEKAYREARHGVRVGTGEYDWVMYNVNIGLGEIDESIYHTNCDDDYITDIYYRGGNEFHQIEFDLDFNPSDDFETFFVLTKGRNIYVTDVETTHTPWFNDDWIDIRGLVNQAEGYRITEIWIRTVD